MLSCHMAAAHKGCTTAQADCVRPDLTVAAVMCYLTCPLRMPFAQPDLETFVCAVHLACNVAAHETGRCYTQRLKAWGQQPQASTRVPALPITTRYTWDLVCKFRCRSHAYLLRQRCCVLQFSIADTANGFRCRTWNRIGTKANMRAEARATARARASA